MPSAAVPAFVVDGDAVGDERVRRIGLQVVDRRVTHNSLDGDNLPGAEMVSIKREDVVSNA